MAFVKYLFFFISEYNHSAGWANVSLFMIYGLVARKERKAEILLRIHHKIPCKEIKNEVPYIQPHFRHVPKKQINQHALFYMSFDIPPISPTS